MEWLLGAGSTVGVVGVVALGIYLAKMAGDNRKDLHALLQSNKDLSAARRDNDGYKRNVENRDIAIEALENDLAQEQDGLRVARIALSDARKKLADRGDAPSVAADINSTLDRLSKRSSSRRTAAPEGGDG